MSNVTFLQHFGLRSAPFLAALEFTSLYMSAQHKEALAHLVYGTSADGGIVLLTGDIGTGKSSLCRFFLNELPDHVQAAYVENPGSDASSLLAAICAGLNLRCDRTSGIRESIERLNAFQLDIHTQGRRLVLVIDNAQLLSTDALEQLRLLTNLQPRACMPLQIVIVGQTGLRELLARPELRQLSQRVVARYHLGPLARRDVLDYARHRLTMVGGDVTIMPAGLSWLLHGVTAGVPRNINRLCDRALHICAARNKTALDRVSLKQAAHEVGLAQKSLAWPLDPKMAALTLAAVAACAAGISFTSRDLGSGIEFASVPASPIVQASPAARLAATSAAPAMAPNAKPVDETAGAPVIPVAGSATDESAQTDLKLASEGPTAYANLSQRWGGTALTWRDCEQWRHAKLRCLRSRGDLHELRDLNLPAVLHLSDPQKRQADALLLSISPSSVLLRSGDVEHRVSLVELADRWNGDYTVLWPRPLAGDVPLRLGNRGPGVSWLRGQLAAANGAQAKNGGRQGFDAELQRQVRQFQRAERLEPDGVAGIKTLVRLAQRNDARVPRLAEASPGKEREHTRQLDSVGGALPKPEGRSTP
jgi:general secretion pathway protein A